MFGARQKADMKKTHKSGRSSRGCMALKFFAQTKRTKNDCVFQKYVKTSMKIVFTFWTVFGIIIWTFKLVSVSYLQRLINIYEKYNTFFYRFIYKLVCNSFPHAGVLMNILWKSQLEEEMPLKTWQSGETREKSSIRYRSQENSYSSFNWGYIYQFKAILHTTYR